MESFATWEAFRKLSSSSSASPKSKSGKSWWSLSMWKIFISLALSSCLILTTPSLDAFCNLFYLAFFVRQNFFAIFSVCESHNCLFFIFVCQLCQICGKLLCTGVPSICQYQPKLILLTLSMYHLKQSLENTT